LGNTIFVDIKTIGNHGKIGFKITDTIEIPENAMEMILNGEEEKEKFTML
jgi:hypothetical protein